MNDEIQNLLDISEKLNTKTISLIRCLILGLLSYFADGIQYRELKSALKMSDGKLIANLNELKNMDYIRKSEVEVDQKKIDVYFLNEKGRNELSKIIEWMKKIEKIASEGDGKKCQVISTK
jgi:DNA-binding PadR family transcriptional regulator